MRPTSWPRNAGFIAVARPGFVLERLAQVLDAEFLHQVSFLPIPGLEISSTDLRRRVREGRSVKYLTPETVEGYVQQQGLYRPLLEDTPRP